MSTNPQSDFNDLYEPEEARRHPAYPAFLVEMDGRCFGTEALNDAWYWFKCGWRDRHLTQVGPATTVKRAHR